VGCAAGASPNRERKQADQSQRSATIESAFAARIAGTSAATAAGAAIATAMFVASPGSSPYDILAIYRAAARAHDNPAATPAPAIPEPLVRHGADLTVVTKIHTIIGTRIRRTYKVTAYADTYSLRASNGPPNATRPTRSAHRFPWCGARRRAPAHRTIRSTLPALPAGRMRRKTARPAVRLPAARSSIPVNGATSLGLHRGSISRSYFIAE